MGAVNLSFKAFGLWLGISFIVGFLVATLKPKQMPVVEYIAQEEILNIEKSRIDKISNPAKKQIFFGRPKEAANLVEEYMKSHKGKNNIIVLSSSKLFGDNVQSISNDVYEYIIERLRKE